MAIRKYKLSQDFLDQYRDRTPSWGFMDEAWNSLGEITFLRSYSRLKEDGSKETWQETCQRVIEGMFTIQREHCLRNRLPWDYKKAQRTAQDAYDRMFQFKWLPPGRGLANMGAAFVVEEWDGTPLQNCAFVTTKTDFAEAMHFLMLASMNGVGVGLDVLGAGRHQVKERTGEAKTFVVPDTREGWAEALQLQIDSFLMGDAPLVFDYSEVRPAGAPIARFGGTASGPGALSHLLEWLEEVFQKRVGSALTMTDIADIANKIGCCVVSGSSRRSAELLMGPQTEEYMDLKNYGSMEPVTRQEVFVNIAGEPQPVRLALLEAINTELAAEADGNPLEGPGEALQVLKELVHDKTSLANLPSEQAMELASRLFGEEAVLLQTVEGQEWVPGPAAARAEWAWMSNNSVFAEVGQNYRDVAKRTLLNGEPGYVWMDMTRGFGRMKDRRDNKDYRAAGYNPCFTGDTLLMTEAGWVSFYDAFLSEEENKIVVDGRVSFEGDTQDPKKEDPSYWKVDTSLLYSPVTMKASKVFLTQQDAEVVKVTTSSGIEVRCTPDHLFATKSGMKRADELTVTDKILVTRGHLPTEEANLPQTREEIDAFLMGLIAGDGYIATGSETRNEKIHIDLWGEDRALAPQVEEWIQELFEAKKDEIKGGGNRPLTAFVRGDREDRDETRIVSTFLAIYLKQTYGFTKSSKHAVPGVLLANASSSAARFYIAGLAFADGSVQLSKRGGGSIRIWQDNKELLQDVQRMLLANGIFGQLYKRRSAGEDSVDGTKRNHDAYEIVINGGCFEFQKFIGFGTGRKHELARASFTRPSKKQAAFTSFVSCEADGVEDVYCLQEPERRILSANGLTARRCAEQPLESYELCTLVETFPTRAESVDDYLKTLKVAYLYAKTVTLLPTVFERSNAVMARNRRIGLSQTGITTYVEQNGIAQWRELCDAGYNEVARLDNVYSEWLCIRNSIRMTTVKPSGTVSLLTGDSPGVHWNPASGFYIRRVNMTDGVLLQELRRAGYPVEESAYSQGQFVVSFPIKSPFQRSEKDVTIWEKVALAAEAQHWWSDNSVSVTVSYNPKTEGQHIEYILSLYEGRLKTISFLPMFEAGDQAAYKQMPYEEITEADYLALCENLMPLDRAVVYHQGSEAEGEKFCTTSACEMKDFKLAAESDSPEDSEGELTEEELAAVVAEELVGS